MGVRQNLVDQFGPTVREMAPDLTNSFVREALGRAIHGFGPLQGAARAAEAHLRDQDDDVRLAVRAVIETHVRLAGAQGFVTNLGGIATATVAIPANIAGLALVQCRMIAAICHLRGYDLDDPRVRNAILVALLGEEKIDDLLTGLSIPAPPMALATAPAHDAGIDKVVTAEVASEFVARIAGKRAAGVVGRRVPLVGGLVGLGVDGVATWKVGRYVDREFLPRPRP